MNDIKNAMNALVKRKVKVNSLGVDGLYVRPIPQDVNFEMIGSVEGETDKEREDSYEALSMSYCLVDENDKPVYTPEEYWEWHKQADTAILLPLIDAIKKLNDFQSLDEETKKK